MGRLREDYKEPYSQQVDCIISLALIYAAAWSTYGPA